MTLAGKNNKQKTLLNPTSATLLLFIISAKGQKDNHKMNVE